MIQLALLNLYDFYLPLDASLNITTVRRRRKENALRFSILTSAFNQQSIHP